jgi:hypothetical protein
MPNDLEEPTTWLARADEVKAKGINGNGAGMPLAIAAKVWATPNAHDGRRPGADLHSTQGANLSRDAAMWGTPSVADVTGGHRTRSGARSDELLLNGQAEAWPGPLDPPTATAGSDGSSRAVLNPSFVEALMGFPPSWTVPIDCAPWGTPSSPRKRAPHSSSSHDEPSPETNP